MVDGGGPRSGAALEHVGEHPAELLVADEPPQACRRVSGGSGKRSSTQRRRASSCGPAAANQPGTSAISGQQDPDGHHHADHARRRAGRPVDRAHARPGQRRVQPAADEQPEGLADEGRARAGCPTVTNSSCALLASVERPQDRRQDERADRPRRAAMPDPRRHAGRGTRGGSPRRPPRPAQTTRSEVERVQDGLPSSRAWVRKPVWATIRWSGRTDWPSMCQPRWSTSIVSAMPKSALGERLAELGRLGDLRRVGERGSRPGAAPARRASRPATARAGRARPGRGRSRRCPRSSRAARRGSGRSDVVAEERGHVLWPRARRSPRGARSRRRRRPARSSVIDSAPDPTPDSSTRAPGKMSASSRIGPRSFG